MNKRRQKILMIVALVSVFICGCPGCLLLIQGIGYFPAAIGTIQSFGDLMGDLAAGFLNGGWLVCLSGIFILVPFTLVIITVFERSKKGEDLDELKPTGASKDDPIPPPS